MTKDHVTKGKEFLTYIIFYHIFLIIFFFIFWRLGQMWYKPPGPQKMRTREIQWLAISHTCVFPIHTQYLAKCVHPQNIPWKWLLVLYCQEEETQVQRAEAALLAHLFCEHWGPLKTSSGFWSGAPPNHVMLMPPLCWSLRPSILACSPFRIH